MRSLCGNATVWIVCRQHPAGLEGQCGVVSPYLKGRCDRLSGWIRSILWVSVPRVLRKKQTALTSACLPEKQADSEGGILTKTQQCISSLVSFQSSFFFLP
ncbi:hypothetical protein CEXT_58321 [Caerostris extrusa]|uniref:Uncharacterized protein n=1 Tax=Caerostris extrusa TaxID=172846 RepID=A0AAV4S0B3_CAEEX|nr:hypothetical protein CEXT_58321 [Caerostris extrusa]